MMGRELRLADLLASLSLVADLGMGHDPEQGMRAALVATLLARRLDLPEKESRDVYYTALLQHVGCTAYAHETAPVFGDDIRLNRAGSLTNFDQARDMFATFLPELSRGLGPMARIRNTTVAMLRGSRFGLENSRAVCEVGRETARRLGLSGGVQRSLHHALESWSGKGDPQGLRSEEIALPARVVRVAGVAALFGTLGGSELASAMVRERSGGVLDPTVAAAFAGRSRELLAEATRADPRTALLELEPGPVVRVPEADMRRVARCFGELVDLKSPYLHGHVTGVAKLAAAAGTRLGFGAADAAALEIAALLHDVGRAAVPTSIWERRGALTAAHWEQVRLHAYHSERVLTGSGALAPLARIAGMHHERIDGSGYHRACRAPEIPTAARVLAAADAFAAMTSARPHRPALAPEAAARELSGE
ncbi:MAG: HD domain-containing phosphohydrolase, partial [Candidatus Limnocylindria bacterium]